MDGNPAIVGAYTGGLSLLSTTTLSPDLIGEIRLILAPVDAELGRGNSQVQITTRSGTNRFTGSAVWNVRNTALNANTGQTIAMSIQLPGNGSLASSIGETRINTR